VLIPVNELWLIIKLTALSETTLASDITVPLVPVVVIVLKFEEETAI
jgi:hypothetical protein